MMQRLKNFIKKIVYSIVPPPYIPPSYAQAGEDAVLKFLFEDKRISKISYRISAPIDPAFIITHTCFIKEDPEGFVWKQTKS